MATRILCSLLPTCQSQTYAMIPEFLAPCLARRTAIPNLNAKSFSTSHTVRYPRDRNKLRGVSPIRRTGLREPLSVSRLPLPKPVLNVKKKTPVVVDENHGLWGFFNRERTSMATPEEDFAHGRSWTVEELRHKSWEDLHSLWWVCAKERNRIHTSSKERERLKAGYGQFEADEREKTVKRTQKAIKHALTERWYAWEDARRLGMKDPTVNLTGDGLAYEPRKSLSTPSKTTNLGNLSKS